MKSKLYILAAALCLAVFSCAPAPKVEKYKAPPVAPSARPAVRLVEDGLSSLEKEVNTVDKKLQDQKNATREQKADIQSAIAQAEKIKERALAKQALSEIEATNLLDSLKKVEARNLFLEKTNEEMRVSVTEQGKLLTKARKDLRSAEDKIVEKEKEASELRSQNTKYESQAVSYQKIQKENAKLVKKAASAQVYKNWVIGLVSAFVAWIILKNVLMSFFPTTKFRI